MCFQKKKEVTFICSPLDSGLGPSFGQQMVVERSDLQRPGSTYCPLGENTLRQPHRPVIPVTLVKQRPGVRDREPARRYRREPGQEDPGLSCHPTEP